jgi:uncharacterized membrane protein YdjX (TVP38/TMEM64 family)
MRVSRSMIWRPTDARSIRRLQWGVPLAALAAAVITYLIADGLRTEVQRLAGVLASGDAEALRDVLRGYGVWGPVVSLAAMVAQALVAPIPAFLVVFANGLAYGAVAGWVLSLVGQTAAAGICFGLARGLGRGPAEALVGRFGLELADEWVARWGGLGLFLTRLVPGVGFDGVSYAAGLTRMGFGSFTAITVAGSAPQLLLYAYLGENAPRAAWLLLAGTGLIAVGGAAVAVVRWRRRSGPPRRDERVQAADPAWHTPVGAPVAR